MSDTLRPGDAVRWSTPQGTTRGRIEKKLTAPTTIKGHRVAASKDAPQYLVVSDATDARAAHKPEALTRQVSQ